MNQSFESITALTMNPFEQLALMKELEFPSSPHSSSPLRDTSSRVYHAVFIDPSDDPMPDDDDPSSDLQ